MSLFELSFASGEESLSVRHVVVREAASELFTITVRALSPHQIDLESIIGQPAGLRITTGLAFARFGGVRAWTGMCNRIEQIKAEPTGLSTYELHLVPALWALTQRRGYRIRQHRSIPDIVRELLDEWSLQATWEIASDRYPKLEYKAQYGESDYAFLCRLLEEVGIAFAFAADPELGSRLVFSDALHAGESRPSPPLPFTDSPNQSAEQEFVTEVRLVHEVRPGGHILRDYDFRNPDFALFGAAPPAPPPGDRYEQYHYRPGAFLVETDDRRGGNQTPAADDKGVARHDQAAGTARATRTLLAARGDRRAVAFKTNAIDLRPGAIFSIAKHPHADIAEGAKLLVTAFSIEGGPGEEWTMSGRAVFADTPHHPAVVTPKPEVDGVQSATVVGPAGQEIHTDEFGRVRLQFPWDRESKGDENSSCWVRVSQGWAGTGFGFINLPRIGQEVLVAFLEGDPDQPIVVGRVFNTRNPVPYKLPDNKTRSTWKSNSSMGSNGSNEILFEDLAGKELVYVQAQKNLRKLVKNDESITVGNDRQKLVKGNEVETTGVTRTEVTSGDRTEITQGNRTTFVGGTLSKLVDQDEIEQTDGDLVRRIGHDLHLTVKHKKRELVEGDSHLTVRGKRSERVGSQLLSAGSQQVAVGGNHALSATKFIHYKAGSTVVIEAPDVTFKSAGGFVRISAAGVIIQGTTVRINCGDSPGSAPDGGGANPERPREAVVAEPPIPEPDDVSKTGLKQ